MNCFKGFVSKEEELLFEGLVDMAPIEAEPIKEKSKEVQPYSKPTKEKAAKGKGKKTASQASQAQDSI